MANKVARPSISVTTILATYTEPEIDDEIARLKIEVRNLYKSASGGGKSGERDLDDVTGQLEAFGKAKQTLIGSGGVIQTQATFFTGPSANASLTPGSGRYDSGAGI